MTSVSRSAITIVFLTGASLLVSPALWARHQEDPSELEAKIEREKNPVKKAKLEVHLGAVELQQAVGAYDHHQTGQGAKLLLQFSGTMESSWNVLEDSGRNATAKPQGFMELEIALREDARKLRDLRERIEYFSRGPVDDTLNKLGQLHAKVLLALFPGAKPPGVNNPEKAKMQATGLASKTERP